MRNLFCEKRNSTFEQDSKDNFVLTIFDTGESDLEQWVAAMTEDWATQEKKRKTTKPSVPM